MAPVALIRPPTALDSPETALDGPETASMISMISMI
jgi:hypothetical protein